MDKPVNYVVGVQDWNGQRRTECETKEEVWDAIGKSAFGALYQVSSPAGLPTDDFIPF